MDFKKQNIDLPKYIAVFLVTVLIFFCAFLVSNYFNGQKLKNLENIYQKIATNILSTETKYSLLRVATCEDVTSNDAFENELTQELADMAKRVKYMESQLGEKNENVILLKTQYSLLQIKDYLLVRELGTRCNQKQAVILYFHSLDCTSCREQSLVLDEISNRYPKVRIYWIDSDLETPAVKSMNSIFNIKNTPSLVINGKTYSGLKVITDLEDILLKNKVIDKLYSVKDIKN